MRETRDASGAIAAQYFSRGQFSSSTNYLYQLNHRGDVVGVTNNSGGQVSAIAYDPYGRPTIISGSFAPDFGFTGLYLHQRSGFNLAVYRGYNPTTGRWLNRDPISERGGLNLYAYVDNGPITATDPSGLDDGYGGGLVTLVPWDGDLGGLGGTLIGLIPFLAVPFVGSPTVPPIIAAPPFMMPWVPPGTQPTHPSPGNRPPRPPVTTRCELAPPDCSPDPNAPPLLGSYLLGCVASCAKRCPDSRSFLACTRKCQNQQVWPWLGPRFPQHNPGKDGPQPTDPRKGK